MRPILYAEAEELIRNKKQRKLEERAAEDTRHDYLYQNCYANKSWNNTEIWPFLHTMYSKVHTLRNFITAWQPIKTNISSYF